MPLPVVLGGKSVSAQSLPGPRGRPDAADDGTLLAPLELYQTLGWGVCPKGEWLVRVTCSYYDLIRSSSSSSSGSGRGRGRECTMVEVRIQLSPLTRPLSLDYRETSHHLKLFDGAQDDYPQTQPQVVVSSDRRNLAVLLFHPHQQSSALVIFQLRRPRSDLSSATTTTTSTRSAHVNKNPIPLPSYIPKVGNDDSNAASMTTRDPPAVATHPRFVPVWGISTLACLPANVNPSVFVAACQDGSLVWLDARSSMAVAIGHLDLSTIAGTSSSSSSSSSKDTNTTMLPFRSLRVAPSSEMNMGQVLLVTANGKALLAHWTLESTTKIQQTLLKRASTGTVVMESTAKPVPSSSSLAAAAAAAAQVRSEQLNTTNSSTTKSPPPRSKSSDLEDMFLSSQQKMQNFFSRTMAASKDTAKTDLKPRFDKKDTDDPSSAKRRHMDEFVLKELQKKTLSSSSSSSSPSPLLQQVKTQQEQQNQARLQEQQKQQALRRRSQVEGAKAVDSLKRQMKLVILDSVGGFDNDTDTDDDNGIVVDAQFANGPTLVGILYQQQQSSSSSSSKKNRRRAVAQMFSISPSMGTFQPLLTLELSNEQLEDAFQVHSSNQNQQVATAGGTSTSTSTSTTSLLSRQGLDYDPSSDTFAISTILFEVTSAANTQLKQHSSRWVGCLWNWRSNALSWTIQQQQQQQASSSSSSSLWSRLYFAKHPQQGNHLAFLECHQDQRQYLQVRKQVVATGLLSPPSSITEGGSGLSSLEPNSLLLTSDSVRFPEASQPSGSDVLELDWKVSTLPLNYRNRYGPPKLAVAGRQHGNSIAIASSNGVCVLDRHFKWKQFGTPNEERSFQVVAMTWWEGVHSSKSQSSSEDMTEDLLVAIIQSDNGRQYLSCWSPKRLDLAHQLLETLYFQPTTNDDGTAQGSWGIPMVKDVKATSLSILAEPYSSSSSNSRRAVVLVSSTHPGTCDMHYSFYRLQVSKPSTSTNTLAADSYHELKPYLVIVQESIQGALKHGTRSVGPISSVFLAGASFDFDLSNSQETASTDAGEDVDVNDDDNTIATLGIVRSPGGIEAVNLSQNNKAYMAPVSIEDEEVSKICLADVICGSNLQPCENGESHPFDAFVWTIEFLNGHICCWTVPYRLRGNDDVERQMSSFCQDTQIPRPTGLCPPTLVCKKESREKRKRYMLGIICRIGRSSDWMQQASSGTQTDIALGLVPDSGFGCVLRAGQHARTLHRSGASSDFDTDLFASDFLESEIYGPSEFLMMPPVFVPSLYMLLLEAAHLRTELPVMEESKVEATSELFEDEQGRLLTIEKHIDFRLKECQNKDAAMMALRLLILRSVEMLSQVDKKHRKAQSDVSRYNLMLSVALFTEIVNVVRRCTTNLQFASLFLEVGRQIEPSFVAHLFPLPHSHSVPADSPTARRHSSNVFVEAKDSLDRFNARTVVELFSLCIHEGSLAASASALPLLSSRMLSRKYCGLLLERAMAAFVLNIDSTEVDFDCSLEERRVIGDIFRFAMKMEDAASLEEQMMAQEVQQDEQDVNLLQHYGGELVEDTMAPPVLSDDRGDGTHSTDDSDSEYYDQKASRRSLICVGGGGTRQSSILNYVIGSIFDEGKDESEDAIRRAASSFIDSKRDLASMDFLNFGASEASATDDSFDSNSSTEDDVSHESSDEDSSPQKSPHQRMDSDNNVKSVAELVANVMMELLKTPTIDHPWKAMASLARLILQQAKDLPPLDAYSTAVRRTNQASLEEVLPTGYEEGQSEQVVRFLVAEIGRCDFQIESPAQEPAWVVDLVLLLLQRLLLLPTKPSKELMASLVLIGLIAGHVSGRAADLLEPIEKAHDSSSKFLAKCYKDTQLDAISGVCN